MRTISTQYKARSHANTPSAGTAHIALLERLIKNHPAGAFFALDIMDAKAQEVALKLTPHNRSSADAQATLGCVVDCVARLAAQTSIGGCDLAEYEMSIQRAFHGEDLIARARVDSVTPGYATYHCIICGSDPQLPRVIAESQGTLMKRRSTAAQSISVPCASA